MRSLLVSEYAFVEKAQVSVPDAFLEYLAGDSVVLNPAPEAGRPIYQAAKHNKDRLEWYPAIADVALSGDLGFTSGPWVYTIGESGLQSYGHFLSVWKRDANCTWHVEFDGGISHSDPRNVEPKLLPGQVSLVAAEAPPPKSATQDAVGNAIKDFQDTAQQDGFAAALRTYGRNGNFVFFMDGQAPIGIRGGPSVTLRARALAGAWRERPGPATAVRPPIPLGKLTDAARPEHLRLRADLAVRSQGRELGLARAARQSVAATRRKIIDHHRLLLRDTPALVWGHCRLSAADRRRASPHPQRRASSPVDRPVPAASRWLGISGRRCR